MKTTSRHWQVTISCAIFIATFGGGVADAEPLATGKELQQGRIVHAQDVGSFPVNMIVSPDGKFAITTDIGYRQAIWAVRLSDGTGAGHISFPNKEAAKEAIREFDKSAGATKEKLADSVDEGTSPEVGRVQSRQSLKTYGLYYGLAIAADGTIYAAQGANDTIAVLSLAADGSLTPKSRIKTRPEDFPAGVCLDDRGHLYVANQSLGGKNPYASPGSVAIYDTEQRRRDRTLHICRFVFRNDQLSAGHLRAQRRLESLRGQRAGQRGLCVGHARAGEADARRQDSDRHASHRHDHGSSAAATVRGQRR